MRSHRNNYLSLDYQLEMLSSFIMASRMYQFPRRITNDLMPYIEELNSSLTTVTESCQKMIKESFEQESKNETPLVYKALLLAYISNIQTLFQYAREKLQKEYTVDVSEYFEKIDKTCKNFITYLDTAIDIHIYRVELPNKKYLEMKDRSTSFYFLNKWKTAISTFGYATALPFEAAQRISDVCRERFFNNRNVLTSELRKSRFKDTKYLLARGLTSFGYSCQMAILPQWIKGVIHPSKLVNPSFQRTNNYETQIIYVLDANDPTKVFQEGICYQNNPANQGQNLNYFDDPDQALTCANHRMRGKLYDSNFGWKLKAWTDEERYQPIKTALREVNVLPKPIVGIVEEYLDVPQPCVTPALGRR